MNKLNLNHSNICSKFYKIYGKLFKIKLTKIYALKLIKAKIFKNLTF